MKNIVVYYTKYCIEQVRSDNIMVFFSHVQGLTHHTIVSMGQQWWWSWSDAMEKQ